MHKLLLLFHLLAISSFSVLAQTQTITGTVTDNEGVGLPGVNIRVKGSNIGTITDQDGNYSLAIESGSDVLLFSFIGFETQEVTINGRKVLNITLSESTRQLKEVVVTALGIEREKESLGYASQSIEGDQLVVAGENNIINSLSGKVAGVQINQAGTGPGGTSKVVIRGFSSIAGNNSPLYVVDGVPMSNPQGGGGQFGGIDFGDGISNLNPDDILSINVLKGASGTSLYGSRGQNGVIMITTKKGKSRKGIGVEVSSNVTLDDPLVLPDFQNRFGRGSGGNFPVDENGNFSNATRVSWGERMRGQTEVNGIPLLDWTGEPTSYSAQPNNIKDFFRTGVTSNNSIAFSGGNDKTQVRVSAAHLYKENIMPNSDIERLSLNLTVNSNLTENLKVDAKINYVNQNAFNRPNLTLSPDNPMNSLIQMPRSINLDDLRNYQTPDGRPRLYTNATGTDQWQNPFWAAYLNTNNDERDRIIGYLRLEYAFNDFLKMHIRTGTDFSNDFRQNRNATNTIYRVSPDKSFYSEYYGRFEERNTDVLFMFTKDVTERINLSANLGGNLLEIKSRGLTNTAQGLNIPNFFVIQNALSVVSTESASRKKVHSVYGSVQASYNNYLFVEASARNDWSSALPPDNLSYFYPGISTSLVISEMLDIPFAPLSYLKARGSFASVGNDTGPHQLDLNYVVNSLSHGGNTLGQVVTTQPPVNLKPERTSSVEAGLDIGFFEDRITTEITWYNAGTRDQILNVPVSKASGFTSSLINAGLVRNYGLEISLRGTPVKTPDFTWESYINFTRNRSKIEKLAPNVEIYQLGGNYDQFGVRIQAEVGGQFGDIYADRPYLRDEQGRRIIGSNGLPVPDPSRIKKIGNFQPDFLAGFGNTFSYKNISASFLIDIRKGGDIFSFSNAIAAANGNAAYTQYDRLEWYAGAGGYIAEGVRENGQPNTIEVDPQTYWQYVGGRASTFAEEFLYDGSFVKLREASISYSFSPKFLEKTFINKANISLVGRNLFFFHKNTIGFDPEATFNAGNDQGIEAFSFPSTRSIGLNLNLTL